MPGRIFASDALMEVVALGEAAQQVANVAHLPGIVDASFAMPDIHQGYGFPIGGVAATDVENDGVVSPGGVGFDICCGVRLLGSELTVEEFSRHRDAIMANLDARIPRGPGTGAIAPASLVPRVLSEGAAAAVEAGYGWPEDLERCEERGASAGADRSALSERAMARGRGQLGSLGAGNHFLEVQYVDEVVDPKAAEVYGLREGTVTVMIHTGSRGLGHQTCTDHLRRMGSAMARHGISVPDRQLACVPVRSAEGSAYMTALATASNFAWSNRHILAHAAREAFADALGISVRDTGMHLVFDVAHNLAKIERHSVGGVELELCVHRKGATRAFGPGHPALPEDLRAVGQPVLIPGSMGTSSWVLRGVVDNPAFGSAAHGAGRVMSRRQAKRERSGRDVAEDLRLEGVDVRPGSVALLSEEAPYAYKDVDEVVRVCDIARLAAPVARVRPLGVVKG